MKHLFIINPAAGNGRGYKFVPLIKELAKEHRAEKDCEIELTAYPGHATEIARKYSGSGCWRVYAVGGDGTVNEVLNGVAGTACEMAVVPAGSGNDLVRSIGERENARKYFSSVITGSSRLVDAGLVNGRYFLNVASLGIDAEATRIAQKYKKKSFFGGKTAYLIGGAAALRNYTTNEIDIDIDGEAFRQKITLLTVANARYYGGGIPVAPKADMADGLLDVTVMPERTLYELAKIAPFFFTGKQHRIDHLLQRQARNMSIRSDNKVAAEFDGEILVAREFEFKVVPQVVRLVFPKQHNLPEQSVEMQEQ